MLFHPHGYAYNGIMKISAISAFLCSENRHALSVVVVLHGLFSGGLVDSRISSGEIDCICELGSVTAIHHSHQPTAQYIPRNHRDSPKQCLQQIQDQLLHPEIRLTTNLPVLQPLLLRPLDVLGLYFPALDVVDLGSRDDDRQGSGSFTAVGGRECFVPFFNVFVAAGGVSK